MCCTGLGLPFIAAIMPRNRFQAIKGKLTFAFRGRAGEAPARAKSSGRYDRLWKVRRLLDSLLAWGKQLFEPGVYIVIYEMMVFCRGKLACFCCVCPCFSLARLTLCAHCAALNCSCSDHWLQYAIPKQAY
jgi:hypothetical protein